MTRQVKETWAGTPWLVLSLILGFLLFGFVVLIGTLERRPLAANDASAVARLRTLYDSNVAYEKSHPHEGYARKLGDLAQRPGEPQDFWAIDPDLAASGEKNGYSFAYSSQSTRGDGTIDAYQVFADPLVPGKTGKHHFFVNESGTIRMSDRGQANAASDPIQ